MAELQKQIEQMRSICDRLDKTPLGLKQRSNGRITLKTSFETDMLLFMIALSNGDGTIDVQEAREIGKILGFRVKKEQIDAFIEKQGLQNYVLDESLIPLTMQALVDADQDILQGEMDAYRDGRMSDQDPNGNESDDRPSEVYVPASMLLYEIYRTIGGAVIYSNEEVDDQENEGYIIYLAALKSYILEELSFDEEQFEEREELLEEDEA